MTDDQGGPFGCVFWAIGAFIVIVVAMVVLPGGDSKSTPAGSGGTQVESNSTLSNNEILSRNQANLFSDVTNEFYDCNAYGACQFQYDSSQHNPENTVTIEGGERNSFVWTLPNGQNAVSMSDGTVACENPEAPGQFAVSFCRGE